MKKIYPKKLSVGNEIRVVAPALSLKTVSKNNRKIANKRFLDLGLKLTFGKHIEENDEFGSSSIKSRLEDLHEAFRDKKVKAIIAAIGGSNSNQLLDYLNWNLIKNNPKILCGYSDITALSNAIYAKTGLISYSGPNYSTFGQELYFGYNLEYFKKCLFSDRPYEIKPTEKWSDDPWDKNQKARKMIKNKGFLVINEGLASGTILGANLATFNLLQGTEYFPDLQNSVLFLEDEYEVEPDTFDRDLQSVLHLPDFKRVKGIVIGRFQKASKMTDEKLIKIIKTKKELNNLPVIANVDFGHTDQHATFPIGGEVDLQAQKNKTNIKILKH